MKTFYLLLITGALAVLLMNRKQLHKKLHLFIPLLLLALLADGLRSWPGEDHLLSQSLFTLYTPAEYTLQCLVIAAYLKNSPKRKLLLASIPVFIVAALFIQLVMKEQDGFYTYFDIVIQGPLICLWTLFYFTERAQDEQDVSGWSNPMMIISLAHLLFFTLGFIAYGLRSYYLGRNEPAMAENVSWIGRAGNLLMYSLYLRAFATPWISPPTKFY